METHVHSRQLDILIKTMKIYILVDYCDLIVNLKFGRNRCLNHTLKALISPIVYYNQWCIIQKHKKIYAILQTLFCMYHYVAMKIWIFRNINPGMGFIIRLVFLVKMYILCHCFSDLPKHQCYTVHN